MTTIHFPRSFTEEEETLLKRYTKLRKKKKALQALRAPKVDFAVSKEPPAVCRSATESAEIKEDIKKLVKAGAIKLDSDREKKAFKRKIKDVDRSERTSLSGFHPIDQEIEEIDQPSASKKVKGLYDSFVSGIDTSGSEPTTDEAERTPERTNDDRRPPRRDFPKRGNTICINAHNVNEKLVREKFAKYGEIINIKVECDRKRCFLSYANNESAANAIEEMDCKLVSGIYLKVMLARRQPTFNNIAVPEDANLTKPIWEDEDYEAIYDGLPCYNGLSCHGLFAVEVAMRPSEPRSNEPLTER